MIADDRTPGSDTHEPVLRPAPLGRAGGGAGLAGPAGAVLAGTLDVLCRSGRLGLSEIGDHIDVVAELADALASLSDRLAHDLAAGATDPEVVRDLSAVRDGLARASSTARRCADDLYRAHLGTSSTPEPTTEPSTGP